MSEAGSALSKDLVAQKHFLNNGIFGEGLLPRFSDKLEEAGWHDLRSEEIEIFQVNVGYMCNQTCKHCHVDAGPHRKEMMSEETMSLCLDKISEFGSHTVDITGGAPEMNPIFREFVKEIRARGVKEIIVRSNLTIILANPKFHDLPEFFKEHNIRVVSSLPFYQASRTDKQRGKGVFGKSIEALKRLNAVGYGKNGLNLDLVYNPGGAFLPDSQESLESIFKERLLEEHGVIFNQLMALTNLPVNRFLDYLVASGNYEDYMDVLVNAFNPASVQNLMCRNTISVDYLGNVYDCDFNQMLDMPVNTEAGFHLSQLSRKDLEKRRILTSQHCYGCTAGAGSSCQGSIT